MLFINIYETKVFLLESASTNILKHFILKVFKTLAWCS